MFFSFFFGRYITTPPIKDILASGFGLAIIYPPEVVPDSAEPALQRLSALTRPSGAPARAIGVWAAHYSAAAKLLKSSGHAGSVVAYGHSRYGKAALVAAAFYDNIDSVIAHQSGTGGASLNRDKPGESVAQITKSYPHWFADSYSSMAPNIIDQHMLLALIAPRPVLLGNARRDVWSDPEGAFRAASAASEIYSLYGETGLAAKSLSDFRTQDTIAFWIRPGTHGVVKEDWPAFLQFSQSHF